MKPYAQMSRAEQQQEYAAVQATYQNLKVRGLKLNMARGKPGKAQLDMVTDMFNILVKPEEFMCDGIETRNYGEVAGLPAAGIQRTPLNLSRMGRTYPQIGI